MAENALLDSHGRRIEYMRISLTDRCNYRCVYCMPPEGERFIPHGEILSYEEFLRLCRITASLGISKYKITGGEPLCRKGAVDFIRRLKAVPGVTQTTITTNGSLLGPHVAELAALGIDGVTVSLDSLDPARFADISRSRAGMDAVIAAMRDAKERGLRVKINVVPLKGRNEDELVRLAAFALERGIHIRFIELMPVGAGRVYEGVPQETVRTMMEDCFGSLRPLDRTIGNGPAECFSVAGLGGSIGFISALSKKFCHKCNRIRLTSLGYLKSCLHHAIGVDIKPMLRGGASDSELADAIVGAVRKKPLAHEFSRAREPDAPRSFYMNSVGG